MATAIDHAIAKGADVINISQDTTKALTETSDLGRAVARALAKDIVVVASAGNDGMNGRLKRTYPAAFDGVLAVASSDRNNERAPSPRPVISSASQHRASTSSPPSRATASAPTTAPASPPRTSPGSPP